MKKEEETNPKQQKTDEILKDTFYNPREGLTSVNKLFKTIHNKRPRSVTQAEVRDWYYKQPAVEIHRPRKRPKEFTTIDAIGPAANYQMDFAMLGPLAYFTTNYLLCIVDVYSRKAAARALKKRTAAIYMVAIEDMIKNDFDGKYPTNMNCDREFTSALFQNWAKQHNITMYYSDVDEINKNAIVERFNRTIKGRIAKWMSATGRANWPEALQDLIHGYNNTFHNTIKNEPDKVWKGEAKNEQVKHKVPHVFQVGDLVRTQAKKSIFSKGYQNIYSKQLYRVISVKGAKIKVETVPTNGKEPQPLDRNFKPQELILADNISKVKNQEPESQVKEETPSQPPQKIETKEEFPKSEDDEVAKNARFKKQKAAAIKKRNLLGGTIVEDEKAGTVKWVPETHRYINIHGKRLK
jgi:transposase InsO family protein